MANGSKIVRGLEEAVARAPQDAEVMRALACVRGHMGKRDAWALKVIERALGLHVFQKTLSNEDGNGPL